MELRWFVDIVYAGSQSLALNISRIEKLVSIN